MPKRAFTVQEANELLPELRRVLQRIRRLRGEAAGHHEKLQILDVLWGEKLQDPANPDHQEYRRHREEISRRVREIRGDVEAEIRARGIRFPTGGLVHGLLDFPTSWRGRWVYLCWKLGERELMYWHDTDAGFRGRQRITDEQARLMGREWDPAELDDSVLDF